MLKNENASLKESRDIFIKETDKFEGSNHIDSFLYELSVNENEKIPCLIKVHGIDHSFGITEKDVKSF